MPFEVVIYTDNAAFDGEECNHEVARILRDVADRLESGKGNTGKCRDINGNWVGTYGYYLPDE